MNSINDIDWDDLRKRIEMDNNWEFSNKLRLLPLEDQQKEVRSLLKSLGTDLTVNDQDPFGNGDQSVFRTIEERARGRELFSYGGDLQAATYSRSFSTFALACLDGETGLVRQLLEKASQTLKQPYCRQNKWKELLDCRETAMRHSPLLLLCSAGKICLGIKKHKYPTIAKLLLRAGASPDCKDVLGKTVVHYGAGMMANDVTLDIVDLCIQAAETSYLYGKDVVLKGLSSAELNGKAGVVGGFDVDTGRRSVYIEELDREVWARVENIELADDADPLHGKHVVLTELKNEAMNGKRGLVGAFDKNAGRHGVYIPELKKEVWIKKENIRVSEEPEINLTGKNIVLEGLQTASMNGKKGISGRFDAEAGRLFVYIPEDKKEIWVKPENIRIDADAGKKLLSDVQDRLGGVSLHEVVMHEREDCAKFLLEKHNTSIHTEDMDGSSPLKMVVKVGTAMYSKVGKIISNVTRKEAKVAHDAKKSARYCCFNCNKFLGKNNGMTCAKCVCALYCDRACQVQHWKEGGHKQECSILAEKKEGIKLSWDHVQYHTDPAMAAACYGPLYKDSVRIPEGVKPGEKFVIKVQANDNHMPLMIYDETRTCQFCYLASGPGHKEMWEEAKKEPAWGGRKTFMKASWTETGECIVYPATAGIKNKYSW